MTRVVAIVPTLGRDIARLRRTLDSIRRYPRPRDLTVVVIDNSERGIGKDLPGADEIVFPGLNLGYVGSLEFSRREYECEFLWSIQDDITLTNDVLSHLIGALTRDPRLGVASPVLVRDGLVPARTRAGVFTNEHRTRWENWPSHDTPVDNLDVPDDLCFVSGSGALYRSDALSDIGGFDVNLYPLMRVDVDTSLRLKRHDWRIALVREAHIEHQINGSTTPLLVQVLHHTNLLRLHERLETGFRDESPFRHSVPGRHRQHRGSQSLPVVP